MDQHLFLGEEHSILRDQLRRFVEERVKPNGDAWEEAGMVPRDILREMGAVGEHGTLGACWAVVNDRWNQLMFGFVYPSDQYWRPTLAFVLLFGDGINPLLRLLFPFRCRVEGINQ